VTAGAIALPSSFTGTSEGDRLAFVSAAGAVSDTFRITDNYPKSFVTWNSGDEGPIDSLAYSDSGKLLAGSMGINQVYRCLAPMSGTPTFERLNYQKQPGGIASSTTNTYVGWVGTKAVAATTGDESAFAMSTDDGNSFNDTSLIDTLMNAMDDVAVSADGATVYLSTHDTSGDASVWQKTGTTWVRVFMLVSASNPVLLLRVAPEDAKTIYVGEKGTKVIFVSKNSGNNLWSEIDCYPLAALQDFTVQAANTVYAIDTASCSKTTDGGASWSATVPINVAGWDIALTPNNNILVGGSDGYISFSKDAGATFAKTSLLKAPTAGSGV
jgi:hypothetical protein